MGKLLRDCTTERNGKTFCPFKVVGFPAAAAAFLLFFAGAVYNTYEAKHADLTGFAAAFAVLMSAIGALAAGTAFKSKTEAPADGGAS